MAEKFNYQESAEDALELIEEFGIDSAFIRNEGTPAPNEWEPPTIAPVSYSTKSVLVPASQRDIVFLPEGTTVSKTFKVFMEAVNMVQTPKIADKVNHGGVEYQIIGIKPLNPAGVNLLWTLYVQV